MYHFHSRNKYFLVIWAAVRHKKTVTITIKRHLTHFFKISSILVICITYIYTSTTYTTGRKDPYQTGPLLKQQRERNALYPKICACKT